VQDTELYRHLLGIDVPWTVERVSLSVKDQRVDIWAEHVTGARWPCPECGTVLPTYDHAPERAWRHLDSCQFMTYLHARTPRVDCPDHGVKQVRLPWAEPNARFTAMFERFAIDVLLEADVLGATRVLRISWDEAWHILERAVKRGQRAKRRRVSRFIGVDEKAAAKGHDYLTLVCDLERSSVEYVGRDRKWESLASYFESLTAHQLKSITGIAMDMWDPYIKAARLHVPDADSKIVFDRFHIMKHLGKAVDTVRKQEHRVLRAEGDDRLTGSKYLWLYSAENLPEWHAAHFRELRLANLKTARAWAIKESLRELWTWPTVAWGERHWRRWYSWAIRSRLKPIIEAARTLQRHIANVLTYFRCPITNAVSEGINSKIQTIKKMANGFRNREHFKTAIYFHCGGLQLYPATAAARP
jgi:transposase